MMYMYNYGGMSMVWWVIWMIMLFWIFILPYNIPGQRMRKDSPLYILQKRFASGAITSQQYQEAKIILEHDLVTTPTVETRGLLGICTQRI